MGALGGFSASPAACNALARADDATVLRELVTLSPHAGWTCFGTLPDASQSFLFAGETV